MAGHLVKWQKAHAEKGLVIIDINNGQIDSQEKLQKHAEKKEIKYATLWDKGARNCKNYGVAAYPAQYLVGVDGKVLWEGFALESERTLKTVQDLIEKELAKVKEEDLKDK